MSRHAEQVVAVVRSGGRFGVVLDAERLQLLVADAFNGLIVQVDVSDFGPFRQGVDVEREAVILRGNLDLSGLLVEDRLIRPPMTELQLERLAAQSESEQLLPQADAKNRLFAEQAAYRLDRITQRFRVSGTIGKKHSVRLAVRESLGVGDLDGDGFDDMVFGENYNRLHVFLGASPQPSSVPHQTLVTPFFVNGELVALGDVDGDGLADIGVEGDVESWYLMRGAAGTSSAQPVRGLRSSPSWRYTRSAPTHWLQLGSAGDQNGDGKSEVLVGEWSWNLGQGTGSVVGLYTLP